MVVELVIKGFVRSGAVLVLVSADFAAATQY